MKSTTRFNNNKKGKECLNCKEPLSGDENFCPECGQVNDTRRLSIAQFFNEFLSGFFSFDTRFFNTLGPLLFKPGRVALDYIKGKRKKYTNPFQLYLNISIAFFIIINLINALEDYKSLTENNSSEQDSVLGIFLDETTDSLSTNQLTGNLKFKTDSIILESNLLDVLKNDHVDNNVKDSLFAIVFQDIIKLSYSKFNKDSFDPFLDEDDSLSYQIGVTAHYIENLLDESYNNYKISEKYYQDYSDLVFAKNNNKLGFSFKDNYLDFASNHPDIGPHQALDSLGEEKTWFNLFYYEKSKDLIKLKEDPSFRESYFKTVLSNITFTIFLLLPIITIFFTLIYYRKEYSYSENLINVFYLQTVFFILLILGTILDAILKTDSFTGFSFLIFFIYLFINLKLFYKQSYFKTFIKFILINIVYFLLSLVGLVLIAFIAFIL